jgi:DNA-binding beta-propeller fold protein YncE
MRARGEPRVKVVVTAVVLIAVIAVSSMLSNVYAVGVASDEYVFDFKFGSDLSADGKFNRPSGVAYDHNNNRIIVADTSNHRIQVFDSNGNFLFKFGNLGFDDGEFNRPYGVAYDHNNNRIIVADTENRRIQVFDSNGNFLFKFGYEGSGDGQFIGPFGVAYDHNNNRIIVADTFNDRIQVFDSNGNFLFKFGNLGFDDGQFFGPFGVAYDHNNNRIIVADTDNYRIQVFDSNGNFLFKFGNLGFDDGEFNNPYGVAYDHNNNRIIVADTFNDRIQVFDSNGNFLFKFGNLGFDDGEFNSPYGVAYDHNNNRIIVADTFNYRIQVFSLNYYYSLTLYEGSNPSDGVINLGEDITAKATTNDSRVVNVKFTWIDPSNNVARTNTVNIVNGEASDTFTPNQVGTWKVVAEFSDGTIVVKELNVPFQVVGIIEETLEFNNTEEFINKLSNILTNEGLSDEQINAIISKIDTSQIPSQGIIKLQLKHGSIYGLGVIMPHDPPLNINENIQVIVLYASLGSPININDLHVKAISPTNNEDILLEENWYPNTIDDPFVWISPAIAVNEAGEWHIVTDFTTNDGNTSTVVLTIQTRFGVVPESIIGALSVIGSSLAVLAVYRRRKANNN